MIKETVNTTADMANSAVSGAQGIWDTIISSLGALLSALQPILIALLVVIIGTWIITKALSLLSTLLEKMKVDAALEKIGLTGQLKEMGVNITASSLITGVIGVVSKFVLYMVAVDILKIPALSNLMGDIVAFVISDGLVALILLIAGVLIAKFVQDLIETSAASLSLSEGAAKTIGKMAKIAILVFTVMAVLTQLDIAADMVQTLFTGIITALTLAIGIAFGFAGQDKAKEIIEKFSK